MKRRCPWGEQTASMKHYHDTVWGVPEYDCLLYTSPSPRDRG